MAPSPIARFRAWLKSDLPVLRWVLLAVYAIGTSVPSVLALRGRGSESAAVFDLVLFGSLALFLLGGGIRRLDAPISGWRLWMPVGVAVVGLAALYSGLCAALGELFEHHPTLSRVFDDSYFWPSLIVWSVGWAAWLWVRARRRARMAVMWRLTALLLAGSLIELAVTIPAFIHIERHHRTGFLPGLAALIGVALGVCVLLLPLGTAIALIFLRPRRRQEEAEERGLGGA